MDLKSSKRGIVDVKNENLLQETIDILTRKVNDLTESNTSEIKQRAEIESNCTKLSKENENLNNDLSEK